MEIKSFWEKIEILIETLIFSVNESGYYKWRKWRFLVFLSPWNQFEVPDQNIWVGETTSDNPFQVPKTIYDVGTHVVNTLKNTGFQKREFMHFSRCFFLSLNYSLGKVTLFFEVKFRFQSLFFEKKTDDVRG